MAATTPASRHSRAADVVEEYMVTLKPDLGRDVGGAGIGVDSFKAGKKLNDMMTGGKYSETHADTMLRQKPFLFNFL